MLDQFIPTSYRKDSQDNEEANKSLVVSILWQAYTDATCKITEKTSVAKKREHQSARHFIDKNNRLFIYYCELLDLCPDWMATNIRKKIAERDARKTKTELKRAYI